ncbi:MAG: hypothetical protein LM580_12880, partial [Thermofilum sp.]|nr:hypothetical protein [Thermofilum sp.]
MAVKAFRTEVKFDWGALVHFVFGLLSGWLGPWQSAVAAAIFLFKQAVDLRGGERPEEASGDVAEFAARPGAASAAGAGAQNVYLSSP